MLSTQVPLKFLSVLVRSIARTVALMVALVAAPACCQANSCSDVNITCGMHNQGEGLRAALCTMSARLTTLFTSSIQPTIGSSSALHLLLPSFHPKKHPKKETASSSPSRRQERRQERPCGHRNSGACQCFDFTTTTRPLFCLVVRLEIVAFQTTIGGKNIFTANCT